MFLLDIYDGITNPPLVDDLRSRSFRWERYEMQSAAREIMFDERVASCFRYPVPNRDVELWRHRLTAKAFYGALRVCGSVWMCPVCAAKIAERRRLELKHAIDTYLQNGGHVSMLTLTFRHSLGDALKHNLDKLSEAMERYFRGNPMAKLRKKMGLIGKIRSFEVTHGSNEWHPHFHILLFYENDCNPMELEFKFYDQWHRACVKSGLETSEKAFSLQDAKGASKYVTKWGMDSEMTKSHIKKGRGEESRTPFDILRDYMLDGENHDAYLFRQFAQTFKGKSQLQWSRGLKKRFNVEDLTDIQVAEQKVEEADLLGLIPSDVWKKIRKHDLRCELLEFAEDFGFDVALTKIVEFVHKLDKNPDTQLGGGQGVK